MLEERHVLVLHCRGQSMDPLDCSNAYVDLLYILKGIIPSSTLLQLHCFTGTKADVERYLKHFPNTYFSYTNFVKKYVGTQIDGVQEVPCDRLLIETDSPYFPCGGSQISTPVSIVFAAEEVARIRGDDMLDILKVTSENALRIFK
jgi:TatD DNase family protein